MDLVIQPEHIDAQGGNFPALIHTLKLTPLLSKLSILHEAHGLSSRVNRVGRHGDSLVDVTWTQRIAFELRSILYIILHCKDERMAM